MITVTLPKILLTPAKVRAARAALNWTQRDLCAAAGGSVGSLARYEAERGSMVRNNLRAIQRALQAAGITFHDQGVSWSDGSPKEEVVGNGTAEAPFQSETSRQGERGEAI